MGTSSGMIRFCCQTVTGHVHDGHQGAAVLAGLWLTYFMSMGTGIPERGLKVRDMSYRLALNESGNPSLAQHTSPPRDNTLFLHMAIHMACM